MVTINYAFKEIFSKIVYYGPGLSGKTTNLQYVFKKVPKETRGELISLATDADRTLYFDFLPVNVGNIKGFSVKFQLYTVPGQVYYNATRKLVLRGVDGLVFVADSQLDKMDENVESLKNLEENLASYGYNLKEMPFVLQYNKRDLPNIASIEKMNELLNPTEVPYFEAVANAGNGVFATLKAISKLVMDKASKGGTEKPGAESKPSAAESTRVSESETVDTQSEQSDAIETTPMMNETKQSDENQTHDSDVQVASHSQVTSTQAVDTETLPDSKPSIMTESENMTNVVVSTNDENDKRDENEIAEASIEETTEHSVMQEDSVEPPAKEEKVKYHPDVLDADKLSYLYSSNRSGVSEDSEDNKTLAQSDKGFDDEATVIADPKQTGHFMGKPQMAESKKVKSKKKSGLFGWIKKK